MVVPILTSAAKSQCLHAAPATLAATGIKVLIDNAPAMLSGDQVAIAGCPFTVPIGKPQPCLTGKLAMSATKVFVNNKPVMLRGVADIGVSPEQAPNGPLTHITVQLKVIAT